jgi:hypothetical protein
VEAVVVEAVAVVEEAVVEAEEAEEAEVVPVHLLLRRRARLSMLLPIVPAHKRWI